MYRPELVVPERLWERLLGELRQRGGGVRESGAFLLGSLDSDVRIVSTYVLYDDLDSQALSQGFVHLGSQCFTELWKICEARRCTVVADIHTHPFGARQSPSDRANPMIALRGHVAIIAPRFASAPVRVSELGVYRYLGKHRWVSINGRLAGPALQFVEDS